jgi:hypothetical protein
VDKRLLRVCREVVRLRRAPTYAERMGKRGEVADGFLPMKRE